LVSGALKLPNEDFAFLSFSTKNRQKTANFKRNFLSEEKRYLTFPVDFLKA